MNAFREHEGYATMTPLQVMPVLAYAACVATILAVALDLRVPARVRWGLPVVLGVLFLLFTLFQVSQEGLLRFWTNHTTDLTGNQVWFDLILAVTIGFCLLAPRARAVGMPLLPWGLAVVASACIALLPMLARVIWLETQQTHRAETGA